MAENLERQFSLKLIFWVPVYALSLCSSCWYHIEKIIIFYALIMHKHLDPKCNAQLFFKECTFLVVSR